MPQGWERGNNSAHRGRVQQNKKHFGLSDTVKSCWLCSIIPLQTLKLVVWGQLVLFFWKERRKSEGMEGGNIFLKSSESICFYPMAMEFIDCSFPENLNNGLGQYLLRVQWGPWVPQSQLPTALNMFCMSNNDQDENCNISLCLLSFKLFYVCNM